MENIFQESFQTLNNERPSGWVVEKNSDMESENLSYSQETISLLSAGNKYLPVIPDISNFELKMRLAVNYKTAEGFGVIISYSYNPRKGLGHAVRIAKNDSSRYTIVEYGTMKCNIFTPCKLNKIEVSDEKLSRPFDVKICVNRSLCQVDIEGRVISFDVPKANAGKIAISREHFFDVLKISKFEIYTSDQLEPLNEKRYRIPMPTEPSNCPIYCDLVMQDYGDICNALLTFSGGVPDTPVGEGNYHVSRYELLKNPFFKIIRSESFDKHIIHQGDIVLAKEELVPKYYWGNLQEKVKWPFSGSIKFKKPRGGFNLAVGFDLYKHNTFPDMAQSPSETIFDIDGKVLYSGLGITEAQYKEEFYSQAEKEIIKRLPKDDPRYSQAVRFAENNHYFFENENIDFSIKFTSCNELPLRFKVIIDDAYFTPLHELDFSTSFSETAIGVSTFNTVLIKVKQMPVLNPGVYHLRVISTDSSAKNIEEYRAFEVMSQNQDSPSAPLLSGMPFLYNSQTETRGLDTDAFDPWIGTSVDSGHYIACANFLPKAARDYHIAPTVHVYQREWFLWLGYRCCDKPLISDNKDLIAEADYVNINNEIEKPNASWLLSCRGWMLEKFIELAEKMNDPELEIDELKEIRQIEQNLSEKYTQEELLEIISRNYITMAHKHWEDWLDYLNQVFPERIQGFLSRLRRLNPKIKLAEYGPANVYVAHLKGPEFIRYLLSENISTDMYGFWQFEDYPYACNYGIERGTYFFTSCLMKMPGHRIYPEIYISTSKAKSISFGCPDGAVFFGHPPFGIRYGIDPHFLTRRVYDYALASAHFSRGGFRYWDKYGFQACRFDRSWYRALLKGWKIVNNFPPEHPLKSSAFISSEASRRKHEVFVRPAENPNTSLEEATIIDVRNTASEVVPYVYEISRRKGLCAGFQMNIEDISSLNPEQVDILVLPPLAGVEAAQIECIRKLHAKGVHLLAFESVTGLEDIFGVKDTGEYTEITKVSAVNDFVDVDAEYCYEPLCRGRYVTAGAEVLLDAEIPVFTLKDNACAKAAFFNVPPQLIKSDQLHERLGHGREGISKIAEAALAKIMGILSDSPFQISAGRLIAYRSRTGNDIVIVTNPDESKELICKLTCRKTECEREILSCDQHYALLTESAKEAVYRLRIPAGECAVIIFN